VQRWTAVVAVSPPTFAAAPLGLLGVAAWLTGDGALQTVCLERLDQLAAWVPLAAMLDWINATVLPPSAWPHYRQALVGALADHARLLGSSESA
jgi:thiosulfate reductase cytochrome b subunit